MTTSGTTALPKLVLETEFNSVRAIWCDLLDIDLQMRLKQQLLLPEDT